jgi:hypothetical protein
MAGIDVSRIHPQITPINFQVGKGTLSRLLNITKFVEITESTDIYLSIIDSEQAGTGSPSQPENNSA